MKKQIAVGISLFIILFCFVLECKAIDKPNTDPLEVPTKMRVTCYIDSGTTATGCQTREGIVAGSPEWFGCVAAIYAVAEDGGIGEFIGYYEVLDTGAGFDTDGDGKGDSIKKGYSLDVWQSCIEDANWWISQYGDYCYVLIIKGVG